MNNVVPPRLLFPTRRIRIRKRTNLHRRGLAEGGGGNTRFSSSNSKGVSGNNKHNQNDNVVVEQKVVVEKTNNKTQINNNKKIDFSWMLSSMGIGMVAGVGGSLVGMGGGFVMVPMMTSRLGLRQHVAHGTSLFAVAATGLAGAIGYSYGGDHVRYTDAAVVALCGAVSARLGAAATTQLPEIILKRSLGVFMILVAPLVPLKGYLLQQEEKRKENDPSVNNDKGQQQQKSIHPSADNNNKESLDEDNDVPSSSPFIYSTLMKKIAASNNSTDHILSLAAIGTGSGFLAGMFGVGGGAIVVPALTLGTDCSHREALGTSLCAMMLPAVTGTYGHFRNGNVSMRVAPGLALGALIGAYTGAKAIGSVPTSDAKDVETYLRYGFSVLMLALGWRAIR